MLQPLAISMIGGMSLSLLLSVVIIPTLYYLVYRKQFETEKLALL
jgi:Cu/Ag efflux pump CusA